MKKRLFLLTISLTICFLQTPTLISAQPKGEPKWRAVRVSASPEPTATAQPHSQEGVCQPGQEGCTGPDQPADAQPQAPEMFGPPAPPAVKPLITGDGIVRLIFFWSDT